MADAKLIAAMQRQLADAEAERLRLVGELEAVRERAEKAEAQLASVSGVTRLELVAAERAKQAGLLAALKTARDALTTAAHHLDLRVIDGESREALVIVKAAIAAAEAAP
jgi:hypothetical protein